MAKDDNNPMSVFTPDQHDYETSDALNVAKDIAWVVKSLWGLAVVFAIGIAWGVTLANDVKNNTDKLDAAATHEQMQQVLEGIKDIKTAIVAADARQRSIKSQLDKLESKVDTIEKRDE
jgi:3-dehydroquinate synthetase